MPATEALPPDLDDRASRRAWWGLAGAFAVLLGVTAWLYLFHDSPPPDPASYHYEFKPPPGENALDSFAKETKALGTAMSQDWTKRMQEDDKLAKFEPGCEASLRAHVEAHRELLEKFQRLMREAPRPLTYSEVNPDINVYTSVPSLNPFLNGANLLRRSLMLEALTGDPAKACQGALELADFAQELSGQDALLIHWLVTMTVQAMGLEVLRKALPEADLEPAEAREWARRLAARELSSADLARVVQVEQLGQANAWASWSKRKEIAPMATMLDDLSWFETMTVKPNMTVWESLELTQPLARSLALSWRDGLLTARDLEQRCQRLTEPGNWRAAMHPNRTGRNMVIMSYGTCYTIIRKSVQNVIRSRCLQTALALRAYELEAGRLPERLEELAPAYLLTVPEDPMNGEPLRWNPRTARLYSVCEDGRDDGGDFDPERAMKKSQKDWGIAYPWRQAEKTAP